MKDKKHKKQVIAAHKEEVDALMGRFIVCPRCNRPPSEFNPLTLDHIVPVQILRDMGLMEMWDVENIQVLCRICNSFKGCKLDFTLPKTKELLIKYLNLIQ